MRQTERTETMRMEAETMVHSSKAVASQEARSGWAGAEAAGGPWGQADARLARAGLELRRLRYFRDLLAESFRTARTKDLSSTTLRAERLALGIEFPELDVLPLWSQKRDGDLVSIPFLEFVLAQIAEGLEGFCAGLAGGVESAGLELERRSIERTLMEVSGGQALGTTLPRLNDLFLPEAFLARVCGHKGLLDRTVARCEKMMVQEH